MFGNLIKETVTLRMPFYSLIGRYKSEGKLYVIWDLEHQTLFFENATVYNKKVMRWPYLLILTFCVLENKVHYIEM